MNPSSKVKKMPDANLPESFNVLMHELKGLGLDIKLEE
jgi:DNA-directed RNA polymerase subunit beta